MFVRPLPPLLAILVTASIAAAPAVRAAVPDTTQSYPYVIVTGQSIADLFLPLAKWRTRTGTRAIVRTIESIRADYPAAGWDDAERVRRFLQDARAKWGTRWVLIGGDTDVIPVREAMLRDATGARLVPTDGYYACLEGTWDADGDHVYGEIPAWGGTDDDQVDLVPDVFVGRAPVSTRAEAERFVARTIAYQRNPAPDLVTQVLAMGHVFNFGIDFGQLAEQALPPVVDDPAMHVVRLYESAASGSYPSPVYPESRAAVRDSLSRGYGFVLGLGAGNPSLFVVTNEQVPNVDHYLTVDDVLALTNGARLGHVYLSTSSVNRITEPTSLGEAFLKAPNGGAVTVIAPTDLAFVSPSNAILQEYVRLLFDAGVPTVGEAFVQQMSVLQPPATNAMLVLGELLLGDPRLPVYTQAPATLAVEQPTTLVIGGTTLDVRVTGAGAPIAGATVTACEEDVPVSGVSDPSGWAHLAILATEGEVALTVTAPNHVPYEATITVAGSVGVAPVTVTRLDLDAPRPNPATAVATLRLAIPEALGGEPLELAIYDPAGRRVRVLETAAARPGIHPVVWDLKDERGAPVRNGLYLASASAGGRRLTRSVVVLR